MSSQTSSKHLSRAVTVFTVALLALCALGGLATSDNSGTIGTANEVEQTTFSATYDGVGDELAEEADTVANLFIRGPSVVKVSEVAYFIAYLDSTNKPTNATWSMIEGADNVSLDPFSENVEFVELRGLKVGTSTIKATDGSGRTATHSFQVVEPEPIKPVSSIAVSGGTSVEAGKSITLVAEVQPTDAADKTVTWSIQSGGSYVSITPNGTSCTVTGKAVGTATIKCVSNSDSTKYDTKTISVTSPVTDVKISPTSKTIPSNQSAKFTASGGDGSYTWSVTPSGAQAFGPEGDDSIRYVIPNYARTYTVTVTSGGTSASATLTGTAAEYHYTLSFSANGGSGAPSSMNATGSSSSYTFTIPTTVPTKSGAVFKGWAESSTGAVVAQAGGQYTVESVTNIDDDGQTITGDKTLYAIWEAQTELTYTLRFDANGGSGAPPSLTGKSFTGSYTFTIPTTVPTKDGWIFKGWAETANGKVKVQPGGSYTAAGTSTSLYAVWEDSSLLTYTLYFNANGGTGGPSPLTGKSSSGSYPFAIPAVRPTKDGSDFDGWAETPGGPAVVWPGHLYTSAKTTATLYAVWGTQSDLTYTLYFNANGGTGGPSFLTGDSSTGSYTFTIPATVPTKSGAVFKGWAESSSGSVVVQPGDRYTIRSEIYGGGSKNLYAVWGTQNERTYILRFDANGGSGEPTPLTGDSSTGSYAFSVPVAKPTKDGWIFKGWAESSTGSPVVQPGGKYVATKTSVTLYAIWKSQEDATNHVVTYDGNGGESARGSDTVPEGSVVKLPDVTRDGHKLQGWFDGNRRVGNPGDEFTVNGDVTLKAKWTSENPVGWFWVLALILTALSLILMWYTGSLFLGIPAAFFGVLTALILAGVI